MQNVIVTGANGFVGNHLVKELADNGVRVVGIGGQHGSDKPAYIDEYLVVDLMDRGAVDTINFSGIDGVIHLAGLAALGPSFDSPLEYVESNIGMEINLFEAALAQGAKPRFLVISSGTLYDPTAPLPLTESSPVLPNSPYAVSKIGQEQMALYYHTRGFETIIARPFNHIGPGQNPGFIVPDLTKQVVDAERGQATEVRVGNLDAKRDYTDVRDIVRAYRLLLEKGRSGETYNICTNKPLSGHEVLEQILKASGTNPTVTEDPDKMRPSDTPELYGSHDKISGDTGWQPEIPLETTMQDVVADWRNR